MTELKLRKVGNSLTVTVPVGIASNMKVAEGDVVHLTELPGGGYRITPHKDERAPREPGRCKGQIEVPADFIETSEEIITSFEIAR